MPESEKMSEKNQSEIIRTKLLNMKDFEGTIGKISIGKNKAIKLTLKLYELVDGKLFLVN